MSGRSRRGTRWAEDAKPENIGPGEIRLLAAAYRPLNGLGLELPLMDVAKGVYRRTWYVNNVGVPRNAELIGALRDAGIPSLVLKGFALAAVHYRDLGARPMEDCDLLVRPEQFAGAASVVQSLGYARGPGITATGPLG